MNASEKKQHTTLGEKGLLKSSRNASSGAGSLYTCYPSMFAVTSAEEEFVFFSFFFVLSCAENRNEMECIENGS